jgi:hypothetical protein
MHKKYLQVIALAAMMGALGSSGAVRAADCNSISSAIKCTLTPNCTWNSTNKKCLIKMPCNKRENTNCTDSQFSPQNCVLITGNEQVLKSVGENVNKGKVTHNTPKILTKFSAKCLSKDSVKCNDLTNENDCDKAQTKFKHLNCQWQESPVKNNPGKCATRGFS